MERCWGEFYKTILGPLIFKEDAMHPERCCEGKDEHACTMFTCHHEPDPRIVPEAKRMQLWDDFAVRHYRAPQVGGSVEAALKF